MKQNLQRILLFFTFYVNSLAAVNDPKPSSALCFKENKGQVSDQFYKPRPDVLFSGTDGKLVFHLKNNGISYQLNRVDSWKKEEVSHRAGPTKELKEVPDRSTVYRLDINWLNANTNSIIKKENAVEGYDNYYLEVCPQGALNVKSYKQVTYQQLYNGIDLKWYEKNGNLKYDYIVAPGANYRQIQLEFKGAEKISINKKGELIIKTPLGELTEAAPYVIQNGNQLVSKWAINKNIVTFDIKNIDPSRSFIIDPLIRAWGTYYGGLLEDWANNPVNDLFGNVYLSGETKSTNLTSIATIGAQQTAYAGGANWGDAFIVKFNSAGVRQWGTYYGDASNDFANCACVDGSGNIYMVGGTSATNPLVIATPGSHQPVSGGGPPANGTSDAFLVKFDPNGVRLWGTFYGGPGYEWAYGCVSDGANVYMTGLSSTASGTGVTTPGCQQAFNGGGQGDAFLVKFTAAGVRLWGTLYGGTGREDPGVCAVDALGNVYMPGVTTCTTSTNMSTPGSHQPNSGGLSDGFLAKYDASGLMQWGTYYGGAGNDALWVVKINNNQIYSCGNTSTGTGTVIATPGTHQPIYAGSQDAFIANFTLAGVRQWATYYGGSGADYDGNIDFDIAGNIYLFGTTSTSSGNAIATPCTYQDVFGGADDNYAAKFSNSGVRKWGTYYGGTGAEGYGCGCVEQSTGNIFLSGFTSNSTGTVITTTISHQPIYGGGTRDAFLVKFNPCVPVIPPNLTPLPLMTICAGNSTILSSSLTCNLDWYNAPTGGTLLGSSPNYSTSPLFTTTTFYIDDPSCGITGTRTAVEVTVVPLPIINVITNNPLICIGQSATLTASGATTYTWAPSISLNSTLDYSVIATPVVNSVYTVTGSNGNCSGTNSIPINLVPQPAPAITAIDNKVCFGSTLTLNASGAQTYSWLPASLLSNTNGSVVIASPTSATNFTLVGVNTIGIISCVQQTTYSVNVLPYAVPFTSGNVTICEGDEAVLTVSGGNTFNWAPNQGLSNSTDFGVVVSPNATSVYSVTVSNNGYCGTTATVLVHVNPKPTVFAGRDTSFNLKEPMIITAIGDGTLKWISGDDISCADCPSTQIFPIKNSCYVIEAINGYGCRATDEVCIDVSRENVLYVPNTFTPNGDGLNDIFYISGFGFSDITLEIFDRWGEKLFTSTDITLGWNGKFKGQDCEQDVYVYKLSYKTFGSKLTTTAGHVNLIR
ncbi:MAG: gliding motility-associated C-terminal domain-containing protein [Bacteroidetes bacterium]|nr:gliding motility-associated C-terminal domain-containing protein [Bacteroidota bacterium]